MFDRRTVARIQFAAGLVGLAWHALRERDRRPRTRWVLAGAVAATVGTALSDLDVAGLRSDRRRLLASRYAWAGGPLSFRLLDGDRYRDFLLGTDLGIVGYRLRYGVLGDLPG